MLFEISSEYSRLPAADVEKNIRRDLERIATMLGANRCTLSQISENKNGLNFLYSWWDKGLPPQDNSYLETYNYFPWCMNELKRGKDIIFKSLDELSDEAGFDKKSFIFLSVQSHISVPIKLGGEVVYVLSISDSSAQRSFPEEQIQRLRLVGEIFSNALIRQQKELDIQNAFTEIKHLKDQLEADCTYLREEIDLEYNAHQMIGQSDPLKHLLQKIQQVAPTDMTVLIQGETGTGKELVARAIHAASRNSNRPMVKVNCASLPANLIESELFGHEKGAFTSADARQVGRFELANGNSLFLDEIGELPNKSQAKLLRVLQDGEFERLGSSRTIKVKVRIIAATNRDLEVEVNQGRFRRDLWYRLNVFPISAPPLRERTGDIPLLTHWFTKEFSRKLGKTISRIPSKTMDALQRYHWQGNIRELINVVERAVINTKSNSLQLMDPLSPTPLNTEPLLSGIKTLQGAERDHIIQALKFTNWRISGKRGAAALLDINPSTLRTRMKKQGIQKSITLKQD
ncbi:MAG: sigma 54-interacting transcriptional regulator [Nitrospina sp.]|nr:sigma 54-interacting transcriptional regulator [Nitrospina sp.]